MKTEYSKNDVMQFLQITEHAKPATVEQLTEGRISQAMSFETVDGNRMVLRIAAKDTDFLHDKFAYEMLGESLPVPQIVNIGNFQEDSYYCISKWLPGEPSDKISAEKMKDALPSVQDTFASIFKSDISYTTGYGEIDVRSGNAKSTTWRKALEEWKTGLLSEDEEEGNGVLRGHAEYLGLDPDLIDRFLTQFNDNLSYASEVRRLCHGDPGHDNLLINDNKVSAIIDWAEMGYGDWARDFARLEFWWPGRYGDITDFAAKYNLDNSNLAERKALYWAVNALSTIDFAARNKNEPTVVWWRDYIAQKLV